jgi:predicted TIM-barrel fold metal-dependent hydrolase
MKAPPLSCDCHSHILGPQAQYPFVSDRSFTPPDASIEAYLSMLATIGMERAVIVQPSVYGSDNRRTASAVVEIGLDKARGVAMVPSDVDAAELRRLDDSGIRATRFIATARGGPTLDELPGVARTVAPFGWHIEMYVPPQLWESLLPVVADLPVPVVFDHMGGIPAGTSIDDPRLSGILRLVEKRRSWVKVTGYRNSLTGHPYNDVQSLARIFVERVPDRCVWGSDWPHTNMPDYMPDDGDLIDLLADWAPDEAVRRKILVENPAALYRF